jgi:hypothetical protein
LNNPEDDWAKIELWRWQYGKLPDNDRPLDVSKGLMSMAKAIADGCESGDRSKMPTPFNVCEVLRFCARNWK